MILLDFFNFYLGQRDASLNILFVVIAESVTLFIATQNKYKKLGNGTGNIKEWNEIY